MSLTQDDLQKISELIKANIDPLNKRFDSVDEKLETMGNELTEVKKLACDVLNEEHKIKQDMNVMQDQISRLDERVSVLEQKK